MCIRDSIIHAEGLPELLSLVCLGPARQPLSTLVGFTREEMQTTDTFDYDIGLHNTTFSQMGGVTN